MQITQAFSWPTTNWPVPGVAATQYTVLQTYPTSSIVTTTNATFTQVSFDDTVPCVFQVRPSSGTSPSLTYGPELSVFVNGYVVCRAYIRDQVRKALNDRADSVNANIIWPDDELNNYIQEAIIELNRLFPTEKDTTVTLVGSNGFIAGQRNYTLPTDCYYIRTVEYVTADGKLHLWLKEKPFRGGESTATSYIGYPKLGILLSPLAGRYYPGHYDMYEQQIFIDWDPAGDGDYLHLRYAGQHPLPTDDSTILDLSAEDLFLISLRVQRSCWLRTEGQDVRLSRWTEGKKRDDLPTVKMSSEIQKMYNQAIINRRERRPKVRRLVRR